MQRVLSLILVGNYGAGNAGDDALRDAFVHALPDARWTVVSAAPAVGELHRLPGGLRSLLRMRWLQTIMVVRKADAVVFGGGTLLTDIESVRACFLWWLHAVVAAFFGVPVLFAAQGIGPFRSRLGRWFARDALRRAVFVSVRDDASLRRIEAFNLSTKIVRTSDPVFLFFSSKKNDDRSKNVYVIIPRGNSTASFVDSAIAGAREASRARIALLQPGDPAERALAARIARALPSAEIVDAPDMESLAEVLQDAAAVITQRYHGAIAAIGMGIPCLAVPQEPGDKIDQIRPVAEAADPDQRQALIDDARQGMEELRTAVTQISRMLPSPQL